MAGDAEERFFAELPGFADFVEVSEARHYRPAPDSWLVLITDVRGSTKAIEAGRYKDVNALGVASIVAIRNALPDLQVPYVFGGDGATMLVPSSRLPIIEGALRGVRRMAQDSFALELRVAMVSVAELRADGFEVSVARFQASEDIALAMFSGAGLTEAETRIKDPERGKQYAVAEAGPSNASFEGFECRWRPIPARNGQVASILVQASSEDRSAAAETYREVIERLEDIQAESAPGRPVDPSTLNLQRFGDGFDQEARIRSGANSGLVYWVRSLIAKLSAVVGTILLDKGWSAFGFPGKQYRQEVTANTDFRKFDDTLRMVIDLGADQLADIREYLQGEHERGKLVYGVHTAPASLMTCAISQYTGNHVHFVDGANGGYALAAKQLKGQLKAGSAQSVSTG